MNQLKNRIQKEVIKFKNNIIEAALNSWESIECHKFENIINDINQKETKLVVENDEDWV